MARLRGKRSSLCFTCEQGQQHACAAEKGGGGSVRCRREETGKWPDTDRRGGETGFGRRGAGPVVLVALGPCPHMADAASPGSPSRPAKEQSQRGLSAKSGGGATPSTSGTGGDANSNSANPEFASVQARGTPHMCVIDPFPPSGAAAPPKVGGEQGKALLGVAWQECRAKFPEAGLRDDRKDVPLFPPSVDGVGDRGEG